MSEKIDKKFIAEYIKRNIKVSKAIEGQANKARSDIAKLHKEIIEKIQKEYPSLTARKLRNLSNEIQEMINSEYQGQVIKNINQTAGEILERESKWVGATLKIYDVFTTAFVLNSVDVVKAARLKTYQGHTFDFWFKQTGDNMHKKALSLLENSYITGETTQDAVFKLTSFLKKNERDVTTLTRSYFNHVSVEARDNYYEQNKDLIEGYIWVSVLDNQTTPLICGIRDGKMYDRNFKPVGHGLEWGAGPGRMHFNCRSDKIPKVIGSGDIRNLINRPAISGGSNYEAGDKFTKTGRIRKPTKSNRENEIFEVKQVKATTNYEKWLRSNKTSFIADALGNKELAKSFKEGKLTLLDIVKTGNVDDLKNL